MLFPSLLSPSAPWIATLVVLVVSTLIVWFLWTTTTAPPPPSSSSPLPHQRPPHVSPVMWKSFLTAVQKNNDASQQPKQAPVSHMERLTLYALYQQVVVGDAPPQRLSATGSSGGRWWWSWTHFVADRLRYTAWTKLRGTKTEVAIGLYTLAVNKASGMSVAGPKAVSRPKMMAAPMEDTSNTSWEGQLLQAASTNDKKRVSKILKDTPTINLNYQDSTGQTALLLAANTGSIALVRLLLEHGGKVLLDVTDQDGISVLQTAVAAGHVDLCRVLLTEYGADPDQEDNDGDTPRSSAEMDGCPEMQQLFAQFSVLHK